MIMKIVFYVRPFQLSSPGRNETSFISYFAFVGLDTVFSSEILI